MFEYKSEVFKTSTSLASAGVKKLKVDKIDELDQLINQRTSEGWELAFQSMALDASLAQYSILLTFRKPKD